MTDKTEALARLARLDAIEREAAELRRIIEAPETLKAVVKKPLLPDCIIRAHLAWSGTPNAGHKDVQAYAEAFNTLLDLRRQPGSEAVEDNKKQWGIYYKGDVWSASFLSYKLSEVCPWFDSQEAAEAAIEAVGKDRIIRMMNTLHGRGYE